MFKISVPQLARPAIALLAMALCADVAGQAYPAKSVRWIVPYPPGGSTDIIARTVGQKLAEAWGIQVIIDNRPGASGMIGTDTVAKSAPDGYSLVSVASSHVLHPSLYRKVPFNTINDFTPVVMLVRSPNLICVHPSLPVRSIRDLIALARARPGALAFGIGGLGSSNHLAGEMFKTPRKDRHHAHSLQRLGARRDRCDWRSDSDVDPDDHFGGPIRQERKVAGTRRHQQESLCGVCRGSDPR